MPAPQISSSTISELVHSGAGESNGPDVAEWCEVHAVLDAIIETKTKKNMRKQIIFFNYLLFIYSFL